MCLISDVIITKDFLLDLFSQFHISLITSVIRGSKGDFGGTKRKRKKLDDIFVKSQEGALFKHFKRPATTKAHDQKPHCFGYAVKLTYSNVEFQTFPGGNTQYARFKFKGRAAIDCHISICIRPQKFQDWPCPRGWHALDQSMNLVCYNSGTIY